ncbi:hypothetical protein TB2_011385 [Malus domestica]
MWDDLACGAVVYQLHFKRRVGDRVTPFFTKVSDSMPNALAFCCIGVVLLRPPPPPPLSKFQYPFGIVKPNGASGIVRNLELEWYDGIVLYCILVSKS